MQLSRVEIITGISKIEPLKKALGKFRITGMTVYQVLGCGVQHGTQEFEVADKNGPTRPIAHKETDLCRPALATCSTVP